MRGAAAAALMALNRGFRGDSVGEVAAARISAAVWRKL